MIGRRCAYVLVQCLMLLALTFVLPSGLVAQVEGGASTNAVAGPDCREQCGEISDPSHPGSTGHACVYGEVGEGDGVDCWYTTTDCGFRHVCGPPVYQANIYTGEGEFRRQCRGPNADRLVAEEPEVLEQSAS